ncbi:MAG: hypothetical protein GWP05_10065, partial [Anaerolineaceae bacterium]|nr:hypothetical protein [Anaerolineaceae bacterium]
MRCTLLAAVLVCCTLPAGQARAGDPAATVRKDHPRIFVTAEGLASLRKRCRTLGREDFQRMLSAGWIMGKKPGAGWSDVSNMPMPAFLYLVTGQAEYLDKTKEFLDALEARMPRDQYLTPAALRAAAMCYDWIFTGLTPRERSRYGKLLVGLARHCQSMWRHSDFNNHFLLERVVVLYAGVALIHDGPDQAAAREFLAEGARMLRRQALPAAEEIAGRDDPRAQKVGRRPTAGAGGQAEGFSYNDWGYAQPLAHLVEMWRTATGQDLFEGSTFLRSQARWHLYCLRPDTRTFARNEDCPSSHAPGANLKNFMHLLAARYQDPFAEGLARSIKRKYAQTAWRDLLWRDYRLKARRPDDWPLSFHFNKLGQVVFRSGWGGADDTFATFQCGPFYAGHQHLDNNAFVIHKGGSLAIDSGVNDYSSHRANYYARTIAHNTVCVFDPAERFSSRVWPGGKNDGGGSNDGGQLRVGAIDRVGKFRPGCPQDTGRIVAYHCGKYFSYAAGDASRSYSRKKLKLFVRQMVHLRPDVFVIFDRLVSSKAEFAKTWLLHTINQPQIDGRRFTVLDGRGQLLGQT